MYLIVITRKKNVGSLLGHAVWKAVDFDVICYKKTVLHLSEIQVSSVKPAVLEEEGFLQACRFITTISFFRLFIKHNTNSYVSI